MMRLGVESWWELGRELTPLIFVLVMGFAVGLGIVEWLSEAGW